ncbi:MAG: HAMP domain-containing histidine kinase [Bacteroidaceae bacterium]|nr:HAMP domain-containing histidine kinase [Bacteroidaceae bacterium]
MKRWLIWTISILMVSCFMALLYLQFRYAEAMVRMRVEQFDENVFRSLDQASRDLERAETIDYLQEIDDEKTSVDDIFHIGPMPMNSNFQKKVRNAYLYEQEVLGDVILRVLYQASALPFRDRINVSRMEQFIRTSLEGNGITMPFHFIVYDTEGKEVYRCEDYDSKGEQYGYTQTLFRNDPSGKMGVVRVHFPDMQKYVLKTASMVSPAILFTIILLITFLFTVYLVVRQKHITEMKNDFIHNLTHEFKTPISTISIAAQMLSDKSLKKTEEMYTRFSDVIVSETKRLRFQVEKVLQMSLYDSGNIAFKWQDLNANSLIDGVVETFSLKVRQNGGEIESHLDAMDAEVNVDEMHFTNIIYNLMDNAVKYSREGVPLHLIVRTWNKDRNLMISIEDNGLGIAKGDLKRIFDKFYRVHTGDRHNVKGFGLGLAYVHKMVVLHHGTIHATSELGKGTTFTISIPLIPN